MVSTVGRNCFSKAFYLANQGDFESATIGLGFALGAGHTVMQWAQKWPRLQELKVRMQSELDEATFNAAWERGSQFSQEEALAYIQVGLE